jgi:hypothetical protein
MNLKLSISSSESSYTSSSHFIIVTPMVTELRALGFFTIGHMHVIVFLGFLSPKAGPLVMASITPASSLFWFYYFLKRCLLYKQLNSFDSCIELTNNCTSVSPLIYIHVV